MDLDLEPDERMLRFYVGLGPEGQPSAMSLDSLRAKAAEWPVTHATPPEIEVQLRVARELYVHSFFVQEFATVGVAWSLHAVESALRLASGAGKRRSFERLITDARAHNLIDEALLERLGAGRILRNRFSHPVTQPIWPPAAAASALQTSHIVIQQLFAPAPPSVASPSEERSL